MCTGECCSIDLWKLSGLSSHVKYREPLPCRRLKLSYYQYEVSSVCYMLQVMPTLICVRWLPPLYDFHIAKWVRPMSGASIAHSSLCMHHRLGSLYILCCQPVYLYFCSGGRSFL